MLRKVESEWRLQVEDGWPVLMCLSLEEDFSYSTILRASVERVLLHTRRLSVNVAKKRLVSRA